MTEKEYYNELVLQEYYHKLFDEEIEKEVIKPLKKSIINTFTGFSGGSFGGHTFTDDKGNEVRVIIEVTKDKSCSLMEKNEQLKSENKQLTKEFNSCSHNWALMYDEAKNKVEELSKENEKLKNENNILKASNGEYEDALARLEEENEQLKQSNKLLRINRKDCEKERINERKSFEKFDKSRVEHIRFLQKRLKNNGLSIYKNE